MKRISYLAVLLVASVAFPASWTWAAPGLPGANSIGQHYRSGLQTIHDVAVAGLQSSSASVLQGETANIDVTVQNLGDGPETFSLTLRDDTDLKDIHTVQLTLNANQTLVIGLQWDTSNASPGAHSLSATATLGNDQNPNNNSLTLPSPINVEGARITIDPLTPVDATFGAGLTLVRPNLTTQKVPQNQVFIANADATFQPNAPLQSPFGSGEVQGIVHLEGNASSLGGYIQVGQDTHFVQANGSFRVMVPGGTFDIFLGAPGHIPVQIPNTQINPGDLLTLPEMTLPFGDANGDGKIDILDLSIAASNFGETVIQVPPP